MSKKGFTLIELLGVVTLIALISIIIIPNITSNINSKKNEISDSNMKLLTSAADVYIERNSNKYTNTYEADGSTYCIPIQSLIDDGVLITPFKYANGNEVDYSDVVKASYQANYNTFNYELVSNNECTEFVNYVSRPQLFNNMIAVVYDNGVWRKADVNSKWYSYSEKRWANAVLVNEFKGSGANSKSRYEYKESPAGTVINENDILAYFVWIPRFRYKLFNSNDPVSIDIIFEGVGAPKSQGTVSGQWLTHPAFSADRKELSGIWVAKYEAGNSNNSVVFKSSLTPWTDIGYNDASNLSDSMINQNSIYGLKNVNTHLIQNKEWSAVSYLTQSIYGLNEQVLTNSSTTTGGTNSTTGNIYGIYDMAGLSNEFVTLTGEDESFLGYSLGETSNWYSDTNSFISIQNAYLARGNTSIFNYFGSTVKDANTSFRSVIIGDDAASVDQNTSLEYAYQNASINSYYSTLIDAFSEAHDGDIIKVLKNITDSSSTSPTIDQGKAVTLDLNNFTLTMDKIIVNDGTLTITGDGELTNSSSTIIRNNGTFYKTGQSTISNGASQTYYVMDNFGTATFSSGLIQASYRAISNQSTGSLIISGATVTGVGYAIYNVGTSNTTSLPAVKVESGLVESSAGSSIYNNSTGMIYLTGGVVKQQGANSTIFNNVAGIVQVDGGTVEHTATNGSAIKASGGQVTIISGTVSATGGVVLGTASTNTNTVRAISTTGNLTISGGTISSSFSECVYVAGDSVTVNGGTIEKGPDVNGTNHSGSTFVYGGTGTATLSGGTFKTLSGSNSATVNKNSSAGVIEIDGATVQNLGTGQAVANSSTLTTTSSVVINSGTIEANTSNALRNSGASTVSVYGGNFSSVSGDAIVNSGSGIIEISGGTVFGGTGSNKAGVSITNGTVSITGGEITGTAYGVLMHATNQTTFTLGNDADAVVSSIPTITATNSTGTGVSVGAGTFNFYDGQIIGGYSNNTGYSIVGSVTGLPTGYSVSKTNNGTRETAVLSN